MTKKTILKRMFVLLFFCAFILLLSGCIIKFDKNQGYVGGVLKSTNMGEQWTQSGKILSVDRPKNLNNVDVISMAVDPQDAKAVYAGTLKHGLFYTYDGGNSWYETNGLSAREINAIAIDPSYNCTIYVASANQIFRSNNCSRSWKSVYFDTREKLIVSSIAIDAYNVNKVYAATSQGEILRSDDLGNSWSVIYRFEGDQGAKIVIDETDTRIIYVATRAQGVFKTTDAGLNWVNVSQEQLKDYKEAKNFRGLVMDKSKNNSLFLVTDYGIFKTNDGGGTWNKIKLLTPPGKAQIYSFAVNPQNGDEFYYATDSTFYKTQDGGENWITKKLPTIGLGSYLIVDPDEPKSIYLGVRHQEAKKNPFVGF